MKKSRRELLIIFCLIAAAVLFKIVLSLVTTHIGGQTTVNTTNLPVQSGDVTITISNRAYHADVIVVAVGTTITWVNHDPMTHTVTEGKNAAATFHGFNSGVLSSGQSWTYVFRTPGTYEYTCVFHPDMNGSIIVKQA